MAAAITSLMGFVTTILEYVVADTTLVLFLAFPVVGMAISVVRRLVGRY